VIARVAPGLAVLALLTSCGRRRESPTTAALTSALSSGSTGAVSVSFGRDVLPYLTKTCAGSERCHGASPTDSVTLDLRADAAYRELVGRPSQVRKGSLLVSPGDPTRSFLVDKLGGKLGPKEGKSMPLDPDTGAPTEPTAEDQRFVREVLVPWIRAGARDDRGAYP
jgi:hypothetical protein